MRNKFGEKHSRPYPQAREVRRSCNRELYRTIKKLKIWVPPEQMIRAEELYYRKVALNLPWIIEQGSNRKALADWWVENVAPDISEIWNIELSDLERAFRESFGG